MTTSGLSQFQNNVISQLKNIQKDVISLENDKKKLLDIISNRNELQLDIRRSLHWVIKIGNLRTTLDFYIKIFNMKILRHEEFDTGCDAKCNGNFSRPWSKTMIGYGSEKQYFALELTYNYGIKGYLRGNDLEYIGLNLTKNGFIEAKKLGYEPKPYDNTNLFYNIKSPNGIQIRCKLTDKLPNEPFWSIALNVTSVLNTRKYWCGVLNMQTLEFVSGKYLRSSFSNGVPLEFYQLADDIQLNHASAAGRIANITSIDDATNKIYKHIKSFVKEKYIIHTKPITISTPGKPDVDVIILQDPDEYEICFVHKTGWDLLCTTKPGDDFIDWNKRKEKGADKDKGRFIQ